MTPSEKAKELVDKFLYLACWGMEDTEYQGRQSAKAITIIAVDEMIDFISEMPDAACWIDDKFVNNACDYWNQVKQEIEKL